MPAQHRHHHPLVHTVPAGPKTFQPVDGRQVALRIGGAPVPDVVQVDPVVAPVVVVLGLAVVVAVPDAVELVLGAGAMLFDALDQLVADRPGVAVETVAADAEGVEDQRCSPHHRKRKGRPRASCMIFRAAAEAARSFQIDG